jgi:hypothetical protein
MRSTACADKAVGDGAESGRGSTLVEFLAVALLTIVALLGIAQMAVWVWARNVAVSAAHEGARTAAERGRRLDEGVGRARVLLRDGLGNGGDRFAVDAAQEGDVVAVQAQGDAPAIVPFLPRFAIRVRATAFDEDGVLP